jgi:glycopeptide antibiotics resistance protein
MMIYFGPIGFLIGFVVLGILLLILWKRKYSLSHLLFFSVFWVYLLFVIQVAIFPMVINSDPANAGLPSINLIPFHIDYCARELRSCMIEVGGNILLTVPFGFGINFLLKSKPQQILWLGFALGFGFEFLQWVVSLVGRSGFRSIDINDFLLNAIGVWVGYALFRVFAWVYIRVARHFKIEEKRFLADVYKIAIQAQNSFIFRTCSRHKGSISIRPKNAPETERRKHHVT